MKYYDLFQVKKKKKKVFFGFYYTAGQSYLFKINLKISTPDVR